MFSNGYNYGYSNNPGNQIFRTSRSQFGYLTPAEQQELERRRRLQQQQVNQQRQLMHTGMQFGQQSAGFQTQQPPQNSFQAAQQRFGRGTQPMNINQRQPIDPFTQRNDLAVQQAIGLSPNAPSAAPQNRPRNAYDLATQQGINLGQVNPNPINAYDVAIAKHNANPLDTIPKNEYQIAAEKSQQSTLSQLPQNEFDRIAAAEMARINKPQQYARPLGEMMDIMYNRGLNTNQQRAVWEDQQRRVEADRFKMDHQLAELRQPTGSRPDQFNRLQTLRQRNAASRQAFNPYIEQDLAIDQHNTVVNELVERERLRQQESLNAIAGIGEAAIKAATPRDQAISEINSQLEGEPFDPTKEKLDAGYRTMEFKPEIDSDTSIRTMEFNPARGDRPGELVTKEFNPNRDQADDLATRDKREENAIVRPLNDRIKEGELIAGDDGTIRIAPLDENNFETFIESQRLNPARPVPQRRPQPDRYARPLDEMFGLMYGSGLTTDQQRQVWEDQQSRIEADNYRFDRDVGRGFLIEEDRLGRFERLYLDRESNLIGPRNPYIEQDLDTEIYNLTIDEWHDRDKTRWVEAGRFAEEQLIAEERQRATKQAQNVANTGDTTDLTQPQQLDQNKLAEALANIVAPLALNGVMQTVSFIGSAVSDGISAIGDAFDSSDSSASDSTIDVDVEAPELSGSQSQATLTGQAANDPILDTSAPTDTTAVSSASAPQTPRPKMFEPNPGTIQESGEQIGEILERQQTQMQPQVNQADSSASQTSQNNLSSLPEQTRLNVYGDISAKYESKRDIGTNNLKSREPVLDKNGQPKLDADGNTIYRYGLPYGDAGGASYGMYQIAGNKSMNDFMSFAKKHSPDLHNQLQQAGGANAAREGLVEFADTWKNMADNAETQEQFLKLQTDFIKEKNYDVTLKRMPEVMRNELNNRSAPIQQAIWSASVHHGGVGAYKKVIGPALEGKELNKMNDTQIAETIYKQRTKKFPGHARRFKDELKDIKNNIEKNAQAQEALQSIGKRINELSPEELLRLLF